MKKALKIFGITVGCIVALLLLCAIILPFALKGKITGIAKKVINENVNAVVDFQDLKISLLKEFPRASVSLHDLSVVGIDKFEGDTLASLKSFGASVDVMSYLKKGVIDLRTVDVVSPRIHAVMLEDSTANWDIMKPSDTPEEEADTTSSSFNLSIKRFVISDAAIVYEDRTQGLAAGIGSLDFSLKGDMSDARTVLDLVLECGEVNVIMDKTQWLTDASLSVASKVDADMENMFFKIDGTKLTINRIALNADGTIEMKQDSTIALDLTYAAQVPSLKTLLEMIPASVLPDVKNVDTKGEMALGGWVKGVYGTNSMPTVYAEMKVADGWLKYTELPRSIDNIAIAAVALWDGNDDSKSDIDLSKFHFEMAGSPFDAHAHVATPMTDANIKAGIKGKVNFSNLKEALPLEVAELGGTMTADIDFAGHMSAIEKEQYDKLNLEGTLDLEKFVATTKDLPMPININTAKLKFNPRTVDLTAFSGTMGKSDISASGKLENFLNYFLKDETLKGSLSLNSKLIDCNELLSATGEETEAAQDAPMSVIVLPSNVDLSMQAKVGKILYDKMELDNAAANIAVKSGALVINSLGAGFADGTIALSGKYLAENTSGAFTNMKMGLNNVDIKQAAASLGMFDKVLPFLSQAQGKMSLDFDFSDNLDAQMSPVLSALNAVGTLKTQSLQLMNAETLNSITQLAGLKQTGNTLKDINASFAVKNGRIGINPFKLNVADVPMMAGGDYGIDGTIAAQVDMRIPTEKVTSQIKGFAGSLLSNLNMTVGVAIGGTTSKPTFSLAKPRFMGEEAQPSVTQQVTQQLTDQANQIVQEKAAELQEKATQEASKAVGNLIDNLLKKKK